MLNKKFLSSAAASLLLVSGLATGFAEGGTQGIQASADYHIKPGHYVPAAPELAEQAKKADVNLAKNDPAQKHYANQGTKFKQAAGDHIAYEKAEGDIPMLVLLAKFPDDDQPKGSLQKRVPADYFQDLIFGTEYNPYEYEPFQKYAEYKGEKVPTNSTMQNIYSESSYGKVTLTTYDSLVDVGWVELPRGASYYLDQTGEHANGGTYLFGNANGDAHMGELMRDLLKAADPNVDFSKYAEDGEVPNIFVVHEGTGAEFSRDPAQIWSHKWGILSALYYGPYYDDGVPADVKAGMSQSEWIAKTIKEDLTYDGVVVNNYTVEPEIGGNVAGYDFATDTYKDELKEGPYPAQPGVFAHEFGHALGLPDFYDTGYTSEGVGNFSMMAGGSWMRYPNAPAYSGNSPTGFDPFSKIFLGWLDPIEVTPADGVQELTLNPVNEEEDVVKMEVPGSNGTEYFLFENVQQEGFNKGLARVGENAEGLVAWHIDENVINKYKTAGFRPNNVENWMNKRFQYNQSQTAADGSLVTHYGLSVMQADGEYDLEHNNNRGDEADFFTTGDKITPNSGIVHTGSYYFWREDNPVPADSGIHVTDIEQNTDGSITAKFFYDFPGN
ncbi:M6 family metalloprotease domain-containing protein [Thalassobacillus pellis]|uniref:M6 family metalloprotease domain-containing protein n=1 Tax=Thalassobacillus pellis TaxID=748008 RepID=UPI001962218D|nr:M6 family metalloprotease domain-containing protein [Thalassobacillus pellis]MBM7551449.1 M6 family metalloprotease-like protein [Thalassobacillus pellis]